MPMLSACCWTVLALLFVGTDADAYDAFDDDVMLMQQSLLQQDFKHHVVQGGLVVPLEVRRVKRPDAETDSIFYTANITVGSPPQKFDLLVDTGSGFVILPHERCTATVCRKRRQYSSRLSNFAQEVDVNGKPVNLSQRYYQRDQIHIPFNVADLGEGSCQGIRVRDRVCMFESREAKICAKPIIVTPTKMDRIPFAYMPGDGILGLSLSGLSLSTSMNFLDNVIASQPRLQPQFGLSFGPHGGELHIGGYDSSVVAKPVMWFPVYKPEEGQWQVLISSVKVGGSVIDSCEAGCRAVVDSGTSRVGVQANIHKKLEDTISAMTLSDKTDSSPCPVPKLSFDLGGMEIALGAEDYTNENCEPDLAQLDFEEAEYQGIYTLGAMVLEKYFMTFDWKNNMIGFASTAGAERQIGSAPSSELAFV